MTTFYGKHLLAEQIKLAKEKQDMTNRIMENGGGGPAFVASTGLIDPYKGKTVPWNQLTDEEKRLRMLGMPTSGPAMVTGVYKPKPGEYADIKRVTTRPVESVAVVTNGAGETVKIATDENGEVVATKKEQNIAPLAIAAALAYLFLM